MEIAFGLKELIRNVFHLTTVRYCRWRSPEFFKPAIWYFCGEGGSLQSFFFFRHSPRSSHCLLTYLFLCICIIHFFPLDQFVSEPTACLCGGLVFFSTRNNTLQSCNILLLQIEALRGMLNAMNLEQTSNSLSPPSLTHPSPTSWI